jgi:hypothetical protein
MGQLNDKQIKFARLVPRLIDKAFELGYAITLGDAYRDMRCKVPNCPCAQHYGSEVSLHKQRLAIDLNLFRKEGTQWVFCPNTEDHRVLGEFWESLDSDCAWGGRFKDGNHYSLKHEGRK